jgi:hypothetical protein
LANVTTALATHEIGAYDLSPFLRRRASMNRFCALTAGAFLSAAALVVSAPIQAMQIEVFDRIATRDRQDYVNLLMESAQKVLNEAGRQNDAGKARQLFTEIQKGNALPKGEAEFENNLALARVADGSSGSKGPRLTVEDAFAVTLKKNGIELPGSFFTVTSKFLPPIVPTPPTPSLGVSRPAPSDDDDPIGAGGFITPPQR